VRRDRRGNGNIRKGRKDCGGTRKSISNESLFSERMDNICGKFRKEVKLALSARGKRGFALEMAATKGL